MILAPPSPLLPPLTLAIVCRQTVMKAANQNGMYTPVDTRAIRARAPLLFIAINKVTSLSVDE